MKKIFDVNGSVKKTTGKQILNNEIANQLLELGWSNEKISISLEINKKVDKSTNREKKFHQKIVKSNIFDYESISNQSRANFKLDPHSAWGL